MNSRWKTLGSVAAVGIGLVATPLAGSAHAASSTVATTTKVTASPSQFAHGHSTTLTATVTPSAGAIIGGTVTFSDTKGDDLASCTGPVNGKDDGSAFATCTTSALATGTYPVTATFSGGSGFASSHGQTTVTVTGAGTATKPTISDRVTSAHARTRYGWYRSKVTVTFSCRAGSAPLTTSCPKPVALSKNKSGQSVTRTITDSAGNSATATVTGINVDTVAPTIAIHGLSHGRLAPGKKLTMTARDKLSGVIHRDLATRRKGAVVHYTATARDRAGNVATLKGTYRR